MDSLKTTHRDNNTSTNGIKRSVVNSKERSHFDTNSNPDHTVDKACAVSNSNGSQANEQTVDLPFGYRSWDIMKTQQFSDDGTNTFFWRAHTITVLMVLIIILVYEALYQKTPEDKLYNTKRGIFASAMVFILFGVTQIKDGSFKRPHPAFWRLVLCISVLYELFLIFILFQTVHDARQLLAYIDSDLGQPLLEKDYGGNCKLYDSENEQDPFHNVREKCDLFFIAHLFGWWAKALVFRDYWLCHMMSVSFELLEYSLEHQLPNFHECWWDHWIMDCLLCNGLGIYLGMKTCQYLSIKTYHWRGLWNIPTYSGKIKRCAAQFTPYQWHSYDWKATTSLKRWITVLGVSGLLLMAELNYFYLKIIIWLPPGHCILLSRILMFVFIGAVSIDELYKYFTDKDCKRLGQQAWVTIIVIATEFLVCLKFGWSIMSIPLPVHISYAWFVAVTLLTLWTLWKFWPTIISGFIPEEDRGGFMREEGNFVVEEEREDNHEVGNGHVKNE